MIECPFKCTEYRENAANAENLPHADADEAAGSFAFALGSGWIDAEGHVLCPHTISMLEAERRPPDIDNDSRAPGDNGGDVDADFKEVPADDEDDHGLAGPWEGLAEQVDSGAAFGLAIPEPKNEMAVVGKTDLAISADATVEQFREMERIKASLLCDTRDWHDIEGAKVPSAQGANKLIPPFGITFELISHNEHGDIGVRRERTSWIDYETKAVERQMRGRGGGTYTKTVYERTGNYKEIPMDLYTVTVRATDRWGRSIDMDGSVSSVEEKHAQSDHKMRSIAQTRAQKRALIKLVGGVDANFADDEEMQHTRQFQAQANRARAQSTPAQPRQYGLRGLYDRAVKLGLARDRNSFFAFVSNTVPGCASCIAGKVSPEQSVAIHKHLEAVEAAHANAVGATP